jgi:hypothetical protein
MKETDIINLKKFYTNLQYSIKGFSQDIANTNLQTLLNNEKELPTEFNLNKESLDEIIQKLENLRQETNKILSKLCLENVKNKSNNS